MPFKVVQTFEGKKFKLFTVPSGWETNNVLRYPNKCISKYVKDENSTPTPDWEVIKCKVKRKNVFSYEAGENLVSEMTKHSDTEEEVHNNMNNTQRRRLQNKTTLNLNSVAQDMMGNFVLQNTNLVSSSSLPNVLNYDVSYIEDTNPTETSRSHDLSNDLPLPLPLEEDSVSFDINKIFQNQKDILANQATIVSQIIQNQQQQLDANAAIIDQLQTLKNMQTNLIQKVSTLSVQLEDAVSQILSHHQECQDVQTLDSSKGHIDNIPIHAKPVDNAEELDKLEKQLADSKTRDLLKNTYSVLCSGGKGIDCAYMLVDVMFSRKFICDCSWSGGCRGEGSKVPLKGYKHVLSFFWNMVHFWDNTYTLKDNESFFKTILKNAKKRKLAKLERSSTSRRPKSTNKAKHVKLAENNAKNECIYDDTEIELSEGENTNKAKRVKLAENNAKNECVFDDTENELSEEENTNKAKRVKLAENNAKSECVNDDTENDLSEEENTIENEGRNSLVQQNMEKTGEKNDSMEQNLEENNERKNSVKRNINKNKESNDSVNSEKNIKEDEERDDSAEENERNDSQEINPKENKKKGKERNDSQEIKPKGNKKKDKDRNDTQKINLNNNYRKETCV